VRHDGAIPIGQDVICGGEVRLVSRRIAVRVREYKEGVKTTEGGREEWVNSSKQERKERRIRRCTRCGGACECGLETECVEIIFFRT